MLSFHMMLIIYMYLSGYLNGQEGKHMRRSKEEKQRTHKRIVEEAARQFRAKGINEVGIAELMGRVGLTHGGFYAHFSNKDALTAEVCIEGVAQTQAELLNVVQQAPAGTEVAAIVDFYLTASHRDHPARGCVMPTLAAEIARGPAEVRTAFTKGYNEFLERLTPFLPEGTFKEQGDEAIVVLAGMVGAMLLARAINDSEESERILRVNREFYTQVFSG
jgi:TetR/AcrR family transcriptional regulator, transcriptional repressor for nem operon